jgi:hypothetical protein
MALIGGGSMGLALLLVISCPSLVRAQLVDQTDNQQWTEVQLAVPLTKTVDFNLLGVLRLGRDISRPVDERIGVAFTFRLGQYLIVQPGYLNIGTQPFEGRRVWESRLVLPLTVRFPLGKFRVSDRNLFERRIRRPGINSTRYRNRLQVEHPFGPKDLNLSAFIADEVFYDWSFDDWVRNRFQVGVTRVFNKHFTGDLWYIRQNDGRSVPGDLNVIGTSLRFRL